MKVLVDTCVWSLSLRRRGSWSMTAEEARLVSSLAEAVRDGRVVIVGPVRQELLSGIKHAAQFETVRTYLQAFADAPIVSVDYVEAARLDNLCRSHGMHCGVVDILLCAVAIHNGWTVLTLDTALLGCMEVIEANWGNLGRLRE